MKPTYALSILAWLPYHWKHSIDNYVKYYQEAFRVYDDELDYFSYSSKRDHQFNTNKEEKIK